MEWWFYHLERTGVEAALYPLLEKCLERDWRVLVSSPSVERLSALDEALWSAGEAASFLPHGRDDGGEGFAARQPVLLSSALVPVNGAAALVLLDGQHAPPTVEGIARCMVMFDGRDTGARDVARAQFKAARGAGLGVKYYTQKGDVGWTLSG